MANIQEPIKIGNYWTNLISGTTGESVNYEEVTEWYDGSPMDDSKCDGVVYRKLPASVGNGYVRIAFDPNKTNTLVYKTIPDLVNRSHTDTLLVYIGYYKDIQVLGFWEENDGGGGVYHYNPNTTKSSHDGGCIISTTAYLTDENDFDNYMNGVGDTDPTGSGVFERVIPDGQIRGEVYGLTDKTIYDGLGNRSAIQNMFNTANSWGIKRVVIPNHNFIIDPTVSELVYRVDNSELIFEGSLKLEDGKGPETGPQILRFICHDVVIHNMKLDGNRDTQTMNVNRGRQFTFVAYDSAYNLKFIGGWCINAVENHMQNTSENLLIEGMTFDTSGEHALYLTLTTGNPKQNIVVKNCTFLNYALEWDAVGVSLRDYRNALIEGCYFDAGSTHPDAFGHIQTWVQYDSSLGTDTLKHLIKDCTFVYRSGISYSVNATERVGESGTYIQGGILGHPTIGHVIEVDGAYINYSSSLRWASIAYNIINCTINDITGWWPQRGFEFKNNVVISGGRETDGMFIDLKDVPDESLVVISKNKFIGFTNSQTFGIIRTKSGSKTILEDNHMVDCDGSRLARIRSTLDVVKGNTSTSFTGAASCRFEVTPRLNKDNDFWPTVGPTASRPSLGASTVGGVGNIGFQYFDTDLGIPIWYDGSGWVDSAGSSV